MSVPADRARVALRALGTRALPRHVEVTDRRGFAVSQGIAIAATPRASDVWRLELSPVGHRSWLPTFKGELAVVDRGAERSDLILAGAYEPPFGRLGDALDRAVAGRTAGRSLKRFLRGAAEILEREARQLSDRAPMTPTPYASDLTGRSFR